MTELWGCMEKKTQEEPIQSQNMSSLRIWRYIDMIGLSASDRQWYSCGRMRLICC